MTSQTRNEFAVAQALTPALVDGGAITPSIFVNHSVPWLTASIMDLTRRGILKPDARLQRLSKRESVFLVEREGPPSVLRLYSSPELQTKAVCIARNALRDNPAFAVPAIKSADRFPTYAYIEETFVGPRFTSVAGDPPSAASLVAALAALHRESQDNLIPFRLAGVRFRPVDYCAKKLANADWPAASNAFETFAAFGRRYELTVAGTETLCHGDLHSGNLILGETCSFLIDWPSAFVGFPVQDYARTVAHQAWCGAIKNDPRELRESAAFMDFLLQRFRASELLPIVVLEVAWILRALDRSQRRQPVLIGSHDWLKIRRTFANFWALYIH